MGRRMERSIHRIRAWFFPFQPGKSGSRNVPHQPYSGIFPSTTWAMNMVMPMVMALSAALKAGQW
jgi:hypothetical protein